MNFLSPDSYVYAKLHCKPLLRHLAIRLCLVMTLIDPKDLLLDEPFHCCFIAAGDQGEVRRLALVDAESSDVRVSILSQPHYHLADVWEKLP